MHCITVDLDMRFSSILDEGTVFLRSILGCRAVAEILNEPMAPHRNPPVEELSTFVWRLI